MKRTYKIFWILVIGLIPLLPLSGLLYSVDVSDVGFNLNQYRFWLSDIDSIYLPLFLTDVLGGVLLWLLSALHIPEYLGMELAWAAVCWYLCFLAYRLYRRYRDDSLVLPALALAMLLAKCNFHFFIYNTAVALMALTGLYFLVRAVNDKKPWLLSFAAAFFVLASLCKISALMQFAVFAVLFYDVYRKRDGRYFVRQLAYCVLGFVCSAGLGALLLHATCGICAYAQMVVDMFFYAGNSNDGHTIGNMIVINAKGTLRGLLLLAALWVLYLAAKKIKALAPVVRFGVPAAAVLLLLGKLFGAEQLPVLGTVYGILGDYLNGLSVLVALIYVCAFLICRDKLYSEEFKVFAVTAGALTVLMPIGSNVGITHICNEFFMALPYIAICIGDRLRRANARRRFWTVSGEKAQGRLRSMFWPLPSAGTVLTVVCGAWCILLAGWQSLYMTRAYAADTEPMQQFTLPELRGIYYDQNIVEPLEEAVGFLKQYEGDGRSMVVCGAIPILHYLSDIPPYIDGCGGWLETDYVTADQIAQQLAAAEDYPVVVFRSGALAEPDEKTQTVLEFVRQNGYREVFANGTCEIYSRDAE